jgi:peptide/nickel transport system permease protein
MTFGGLGEPVSEVLWRVLPITILLFGIGTALAFIFGMWLGKVTAWRGPGLLSTGSTFGAIMLYTAFPPWLTFLISLIFITKLGWFTGLNERRPFREVTPPHSATPQVVWRMVGLLLAAVLVVVIMNVLVRSVRRRGLPVAISLGLVVVGWIAGWTVYDMVAPALDVMWRMALPILAYFALSFGEIFIIMRTNMIDTLHEEYIQTATAKGLPPRDVRDLHAGRNALLPVLSRLVISLPYLMTGMVMIEESFSWAGIGTTLFYAVGLQNITLGVGTLIVIGVFSLTARLVLDMLTAFLDPRVRRASSTAAF